MSEPLSPSETGQMRPMRSVVVHVLAIIGLVIVVSVANIMLLTRNQADLLAAARIAGDYHLASTARAGVIEQRLWEADRVVPRTGDAAGFDRRALSALRRAMYTIDTEVAWLEETHAVYRDPEFDRVLQRLVDAGQACNAALADLHGGDASDAPILREHLERLRLRLDQFAAAHWRTYQAQDQSAEQLAGLRRYRILAVSVSLAALGLIGIAVRQIFVAFRDRHVAEARQRIMSAELDHRVKNNLAAVLSLSTETVRSSADLDDFSAAFTGRIHAMARTHEALAQMRWSGIDIDHAVRLTLAAHLERAAPRIDVDGEPVELPARTATPLCLVLHELCTNAIKYGALSVPEGIVSLSWRRRNGRLDLKWVERCGPPVVRPTTTTGLGTGLGTRLISGLTRHELRGTLAIDYRPEGVVCEIGIPLDDPSLARNGLERPIAAHDALEPAQA